GQRRDARRDARMAVAVDDQVARRNDRELAGATEAEPRSTAIGPCTAVAVTRGLDRLVTDRHAHERRRTEPRTRLVAAQHRGEQCWQRRVVETCDHAARAD